MKKLANDWDKYWESVHKNFSEDIRSLTDSGLDSEQASITLHLLKEFNPKAKILEAGCGLGHWLFVLTALGFDVYGIDISKTSLEIASHSLVKSGLNNKLVLADMRNIPIKDNFFDAVVSYGAVEHFPDTIDALKEFFRILKPGGACLITTPNPFTFHRLIGRHILNITKSRRLGYLGYENAFTPKQLGHMLKQCKFRKIRHGILPRGFGCIFGSFWRVIPLIGQRLYDFLEKIAFRIQRKQNIFGGGSFAIGHKYIDS